MAQLAYPARRILAREDAGAHHSAFIDKARALTTYRKQDMPRSTEGPWKFQ